MSLFSLEAKDYSIIRPFLISDHLILNIEPIINGSFKGKIWVDNIKDPNLVYIFDTRHAHFLLGDLNNNLLKEKFLNFFRNDILSDLKLHKKFLSLLYSETWNKIIPDIKTDLIIEPITITRLLHVINNLKFTNWHEMVPKGIVIEQISRDVIHRDNLLNLKGLKEELQYMWGDFNNFFKFGFGIIARTEDHVAGWCLGEYFSEIKGIKIFGIGIETYQKFQRKNIATLMASALIELGIEEGYKIYWDCAKNNVASKKTADKLGFSLVSEYESLFLTFTS